MRTHSIRCGCARAPVRYQLTIATKIAGQTKAPSRFEAIDDLVGLCDRDSVKSLAPDIGDIRFRHQLTTGCMDLFGIISKPTLKSFTYTSAESSACSSTKKLHHAIRKQQRPLPRLRRSAEFVRMLGCSVYALAHEVRSTHFISTTAVA